MWKIIIIIIIIIITIIYTITIIIIITITEGKMTGVTWFFVLFIRADFNMGILVKID